MPGSNAIRCSFQTAQASAVKGAAALPTSKSRYSTLTLQLGFVDPRQRCRECFACALASKVFASRFFRILHVYFTNLAVVCFCKGRVFKPQDQGRCSLSCLASIVTHRIMSKHVKLESNVLARSSLFRAVCLSMLTLSAPRHFASARWPAQLATRGNVSVFVLRVVFGHLCGTPPCPCHGACDRYSSCRAPSFQWSDVIVDCMFIGAAQVTPV